MFDAPFYESAILGFKDLGQVFVERVQLWKDSYKASFSSPP